MFDAAGLLTAVEFLRHHFKRIEKFNGEFLKWRCTDGGFEFIERSRLLW